MKNKVFAVADGCKCWLEDVDVAKRNSDRSTVCNRHSPPDSSCSGGELSGRRAAASRAAAELGSAASYLIITVSFLQPRSPAAAAPCRLKRLPATQRDGRILAGRFQSPQSCWVSGWSVGSLDDVLIFTLVTQTCCSLEATGLKKKKETRGGLMCRVTAEFTGHDCFQCVGESLLTFEHREDTFHLQPLFSHRIYVWIFKSNALFFLLLLKSCPHPPKNVTFPIFYHNKSAQVEQKKPKHFDVTFLFFVAFKAAGSRCVPSKPCCQPAPLSSTSSTLETHFRKCMNLHFCILH